MNFNLLLLLIFYNPLLAMFLQVLCSLYFQPQLVSYHCYKFRICWFSLACRYCICKAFQSFFFSFSCQFCYVLIGLLTFCLLTFLYNITLPIICQYLNKIFLFLWREVHGLLKIEYLTFEAKKNKQQTSLLVYCFYISLFQFSYVYCLIL